MGLDGLTLRAIARGLDVKAPALYWHFKDKQALLDEMATEMYRRMVAGASLDPADTWRERLLKANRGLRAAQAAPALTTAYLYTLGFVTEEQGVRPLPGERREGYDVNERARLMAGFPLSAQAGAEIFEDYDGHFEEGPALVIEGIWARYGVA